MQSTPITIAQVVRSYFLHAVRSGTLTTIISGIEAHLKVHRSTRTLNRTFLVEQLLCLQL